MHRNVSLGYYWPSDDTSKGEASSSGDPGSLRPDDVDGWMSGANNVNDWVSSVGWSKAAKDFITLLRMTNNLKHELYISGIFH